MTESNYFVNSFLKKFLHFFLHSKESVIMIFLAYKAAFKELMGKNN